MADTPAIEVAEVSKSFPGVRALRAVSLAVRAGEVHALVGENGAGKSTLIKVATGVYRADGGQVLLSGEPVSFASPTEAQRAGIATIYQEVNLIPTMSVARNLFLGREPRRFGLIDEQRMRRESQLLLREFGVTVNAAKPLRSLGLGAQQMVAIARAVGSGAPGSARVVIMDEPTSSLEQREVRTLFRVIGRLRAAGIAIIYVSHRLDELYQICDRVSVLRDGQLVHTGPLAELDRLRLVSLMLGRELAQVRRSGATAFGTGTRTETGPESGTAPGSATGPDSGTGPDSSEQPSPVLRAVGLSVRHRIQDVSLQVRPGEVVGLGGLLGAGRSETAKAVVGALPTEAGRVEVAGTPVRRGSTAAAIRAGAVLLPEDRKLEGIIPNLSVRENIVLAALPRISRAGLVNRAKQDEIVRYFVERLGIRAASPEQKVSELSGGNQQKVLLARWLCLQPKVLLLDEPTRGIDVGAKAEVQGVIDELAADGLGIVLISSELDELIEGANRVLVLSAGRVVDELAGPSVTEDALLAALAGQHPESPHPQSPRPESPRQEPRRPPRSEAADGD